MPGLGEEFIADVEHAVTRIATFPEYGSPFLAGTRQRLWVEQYRAPWDAAQEWVVFDPSGKPAASFAMDTSLEMLDEGRDYVIVKATDELDVEEVRLYRLVATPVEY